MDQQISVKPIKKEKKERTEEREEERKRQYSMSERVCGVSP